MDRSFRRWQPEDQPTIPGVDGLQAERVAEERADVFRLLAVDDDVSTGDHSCLLVSLWRRVYSVVLSRTIDWTKPVPDPQVVARAIARNVRRLRTNRGYTLDELASRAGVSRGMVIQIEQDRTNPSVGTLTRIADALGASIAQLVEVTDAPAVRVVPAAEAVPLWRGRRGGVGGAPARPPPAAVGRAVAMASPARRQLRQRGAPGRDARAAARARRAAPPHRRGRDPPHRARRHGAVQRGPRAPVRQQGR